MNLHTDTHHAELDNPGDLPNHTMTTTPSIAERVFGIPELAEKIFLHVSESDCHDKTYDKLKALKTLVVATGVSREFHASIHSSSRLRKAMYISPRDDDPPSKKVRDVRIRLHPFLCNGVLRTDSFTVRFDRFKVDSYSHPPSISIHCELDDYEDLSNPVKRPQLPSTAQASWREMMLYDGECDIQATVSLKGWEDVTEPDSFYADYSAVDDFKDWLEEKYHVLKERVALVIAEYAANKWMDDVPVDGDDYDVDEEYWDGDDEDEAGSESDGEAN